jgi:hypothetical protein
MKRTILILAIAVIIVVALFAASLPTASNNFHTWCSTIPSSTCVVEVPVTEAEIIDILNDARANNTSVRVAGASHRDS